MTALFFNNKYHPKAKQAPDFNEEFNFPHERGVALQCKNYFIAVSLMHGGEPYFFKIPSQITTTLKEWVAKTFGDINPIEPEYKPGTVYKRIYRPVVYGSYIRAINQEKLTQSFISLRILLNKLEELFETIEPSKANLPAYGYKIREILLLACMEVESSWAAVLKENKYPVSPDKLNTNDYVKLNNVMLLDNYSLCLQHYPDFPTFMPFKDWGATEPTESLAWYAAYNKTKHDREENLKLATLDNTVTAVGAAVIMFHAQFGLNFGIGWNDKKIPVIQNVFKFVSTSLYGEYFKKNITDYYVPKFELPTNNAEPDMKPVPSFDWTAINYKF